MTIGIQSNIYPLDFHRGEKMARMMAEIAQAGYDGIEIGAHRFDDLDHPETFKALVEQHNLHVSGIHTLGMLYHDAVLKGNLEYPPKAASFTHAVGSQYMLYSGVPKEGGKSRADYKSLAEVLNKTGRICQEKGITFAYHNHKWEITNDCEELHAICELTDPDLVSLAVDVGWVQRGGAISHEVLTEFLDRIDYLHIKDTTTTSAGNDEFVLLGTGDVDFKAIFDAIQGQDIYLCHEHDVVLQAPMDTLSQSREYLRTLGL